MSLVTIESKATIPLTPEELGRIFAHMDDEEQAKFFDGVYAGVQEWDSTKHPDDYGDMQWVCMAEKLKRSKRGINTFMAMAVYLFRFCEPKDFYFP